MLLNMSRDEWFVALTFGVLIDADHVFAMPRYVSDNGWDAILRPIWDDGSGLPWKSLFHYPVGAFVVAPLAIGWRYLIPLLFWSVHVFLDYFQSWTIEYSAPVESLLIVGVSSGIVFVAYSSWKHLEPDGDFRIFTKRVAARMRSSASTYGRSIRARLGST